MLTTTNSTSKTSNCQQEDSLGAYIVFLEKELLPVPPIVIQDKFQKKVQPLIDLTQNLGARNANLRQTRDPLLPKLISGEIDVSDLDIVTD